MTPEQAKGFVCPVRGQVDAEGFIITEDKDGKHTETQVRRNRECIGPACMWWVVSEIHLNSGNCAVREIIDWAEAISRDA